MSKTPSALRKKSNLLFLIQGKSDRGNELTEYFPDSDQLLRYYGTVNTGLFGQDLWWQSGNFISALATFFQLDPDYGSIHSDIFATTLAEAPGYGDYTNFLDNWYDDEGWWGNAFLDVYDYTGNATYLDQSITIYNDIINGLGTPCGGIWWDKANTYVAAIANGRLSNCVHNWARFAVLRR